MAKITLAKEGRKAKEIPEFEKFLKMQKDCHLTVSECCWALAARRYASSPGNI